MKLTDEKCIKMLKKVNIYDLEYDVETYPENERDGRTDLEFLRDEAEYFLECYEEEGHVFHDDLTDAREKLRETNYGRTIPLDINRGFKPKIGYFPSDIQTAKDTVNEYNRLKRLVAKLQTM